MSVQRRKLYGRFSQYSSVVELGGSSSEGSSEREGEGRGQRAEAEGAGHGRAAEHLPAFAGRELGPRHRLVAGSFCSTRELSPVLDLIDGPTDLMR